MSELTPAVTSLLSGLVIDRSELIKLNSEELNSIFVNACVASRIYVIDSAKTFFTSDNMLKLIEDKDDRYMLIAEKAGINIDHTTVALIQRADELKAEIVEKLTPPTPPYPFARTPEGWSIDDDLNIGKTRVSRKRDAGLNRMSTGYALSLKQAETLWLAVSPRWAKINPNSWVNYVYIYAGGTKSITLSDQDVRIYQGYEYLQVGCQNVYRYELEQLALKMGWAFPEVPTKK